jgi:hypothetical protein
VVAGVLGFVHGPFPTFALVYIAVLVAVWLLVRKLRSIARTVDLGKPVRMKTVLGSLNVEPHSQLDPRLAEVLRYPGAMPVRPEAPESDLNFTFGNGQFTRISASYYTLTPFDIVWEFYQRELPQWTENRAARHGHDRRELQQHSEQCERSIVVRSAGDRTIIENSITSMPQGRAASQGSGS